MHPCPTCSKPVTHRQRKYCSKECHRAQAKKIEAKCENCNTTFWRYQSQIDHQVQRGDSKAGKFCSTTCYHAVRKKRHEEALTP